MGAHRSSFFVAAACAAGLGLAGPARAGHDGAAASAMVDLQRAYRSQPVCERITLQVRTAPASPTALSRVARASMLLRMDIAPRGIDDVPIVSLDLGTLLLTASDGQVVVTHPRDSTMYVEMPYAGPLAPRSFAQALQPVPLPELDLAAAGAIEEPCTEFWPYALNIRWTGVDRDGRAPGRRIIRGTCDGGTVSLSVVGNRLRALTIDRADPKAVFLFTFTPTGPCEPQRCAIDVSKRTRVQTLADLRPRAGLLRVGAKMPDMPISPPAGGVWSVADLLEPPPEAVIVGMTGADHAVLVLTKSVGESGSIPSLPRLDLGRLSDLLRQMRAASFQPRQQGKLGDLLEDPLARFGFARVLVLSNAASNEVLGQMKTAQNKWSEHLLWTTSPSATIDVLAPGADGAVAIIDGESVLRSVWPIDPAHTAEQVADQIQAALFELAPTEGKRQ